MFTFQPKENKNLLLLWIAIKAQVEESYFRASAPYISAQLSLHILNKESP
jgi:hypothetical protein